MARVRYKYGGASTWVTLVETDPLTGKATEVEVPLRSGGEADLDPANPYVQSLISRGLLVEVGALGAAPAPAAAVPQGSPMGPLSAPGPRASGRRGARTTETNETNDGRD